MHLYMRRHDFMLEQTPAATHVGVRRAKRWSNEQARHDSQRVGGRHVESFNAADTPGTRIER
jgi:hypothetical protein